MLRILISEHDLPLVHEQGWCHYDDSPMILIALPQTGAEVVLARWCRNCGYTRPALWPTIQDFLDAQGEVKVYQQSVLAT